MTPSSSLPLYIKLNYFAIFGHFISAICMIFLYSSKKSLVIPYTETFQSWDKTNSTCSIGTREFNTTDGIFCIGSVTKPVSCEDDICYGIDLGWLIISFHILSFVFQSFAACTNKVGPICGYQYKNMILNNKNPLRFIEYSFSASIMLISIALLNGVTDINLITSIGILTSACQLCGLAVEYVENIRIKWLLHFTGWLQFCWAYGIIGHAFFKSIDASSDTTGGGPPSFVYVIVILLFLLYSSFGFVQLVELSCVINPYKKEQTYVILSLTAKLLLGWMIFSNVLLLGN
tara:strand:- start:542 stop:1408 length:867 start_codon:yes stop_codon:yes gene_type:complete